jgi:hypothetical protein
MATLESAGYKQIPHEPCCYIRNDVIIFFYVNDVIIIYRKKSQKAVDQLIEILQKHYNITGGDQAQWVLGMEVLCDRRNRLIWLGQEAYLEKIAKLATNRKIYQTPMEATELLAHTTHASPAEIQLYQRKIGSILFAAISTRPDVAFAVFRLAKFLNNPSPMHQNAVNKMLMYLYNTRHLSLRFRSENRLIIANNVLFANNTFDRKNLQTFAIKLFDGVIN